uniref:VWFA domain-containing protein n=1 Tax=viral metagenome TaxID=1070528 RepID=A0A6C0K094_9ZZZZ
MSPVIQSTMLSILQFTPPGTSLPVELFPLAIDEPIVDESPQYKFGVLEITTPDKDALPHTWDVKFDIDCSGSMSDICMDGRSKLQHIKHVIANMLRLFASYSDITFNVSVEAFDDGLHPIFDFVRITSDNVEQYIAKINAIYPRGQTNLILPLTQTAKQMAARISAFPANKRLHFLLTDGNDTCRNSSKKILNVVDVQYDTIVFGFGQDHDSKTLMAIGEKPFCEYAFIAELEKAGIVYGEYIHNVLYRCIEGGTVLLHNAEIYCWKTNTWSSTLTIGNIASGMKKSYYVRTKELVETVCGEIHGRKCLLDNADCEFIKLDDFDAMPHLVSEDGEVDANEFKDHSLRFKTLELLYEVAHLNDEDVEDEVTDEENKQQTSAFPSSWFTPKKSDDKYYSKVNELKEKILTLYRTIRDYKIATYRETENTFLAALMDDLYIARRSFDHNNGRLYTMARQKTQGTQNVYTPTNIDSVFNNQQSIIPTSLNIAIQDDEEMQQSASVPIHPTPFPLPLGIGRSGGCNAMFAGDEYDILSHNISCITQDNYSTPRMLDIIRSTSDVIGNDDLV